VHNALSTLITTRPNTSPTTPGCHRTALPKTALVRERRPAGQGPPPAMGPQLRKKPGPVVAKKKPQGEGECWKRVRRTGGPNAPRQGHENVLRRPAPLPPPPAGSHYLAPHLSPLQPKRSARTLPAPAARAASRGRSFPMSRRTRRTTSEVRAVPHLTALAVVQPPYPPINLTCPGHTGLCPYCWP
jgi:hypothetical protein